ncbi:MAG: transketolase [Chloroflexi bacterium HGW-Chloroflexi-10]|nr:MAG: transketolase [Chloroflexi bacterium HGW-Chloroflexi-10]
MNMIDMPQREAYGRSLADYGSINEKIVVLDADTSSSTLTHFFGTKFPDRFFNIGIAEPCMVDFGVGMSLGGFIPFVNAFAAFLSLRAIEQVRTCIAYAETNVKLVGHYAGLSDYKDGPTHNCIVDVAVMRALPNITVIVPSDNNQIKNWLPVIASHQGPIYFRMSRDNSLPVHPENIQPQIGKAIHLRDGSDVTLIANGTMVGRVLLAADILNLKGISTRVLELHTLKPLDIEAICSAAAETGAIVTAEEHSIIGGLGGAVSETIAENCPVPLIRVGVKDRFGVTALDAQSLMDYMGLRVEDIVEAALQVIRKK